MAAVLSDLKLMPEQVVMVGDDLVHDIYGAQELNIFGVLVKTGKYQKEDELNKYSQPEIRINSFKDLPKYLGIA